MKDYKGLYHNIQDKTQLYEFGAHFKYEELYNCLKELQLKQEKNEPLEEENNVEEIKNENKEEIELPKKRKKYKMKTHFKTENKRYLITDTHRNDKENNEFSIIEEEQENKNDEIRKNKLYVTKSRDKIRLPQISSNSLISLQKNNLHQNLHKLTQSKEIPNINRSRDFRTKSKRINFPKLNSLHLENIKENSNMIVETQSIFQDQENGAINIFDDSYDKTSKLQNVPKYHRNKKFPKLYQLSQDTEEKNEALPRLQRKSDKLLSIFEKEKKIKNYNNSNLFLGEKSHYTNKEHRDVMRDEMAQQIHNLKKQLLGFPNKNLKGLYQ